MTENMRLPINCFAIRRQILFVTVYLQHNHNSKVVYETNIIMQKTVLSHMKVVWTYAGNGIR